MISSQCPSAVVCVVKALALVAGLMAAGFGWYAAYLWREASLIEMPQYDPPVTSIDDAPALHQLSSTVQLNGTVEALRIAGALNARAARWTAVAAVLTGAAGILGALSG